MPGNVSRRVRREADSRYKNSADQCQPHSLPVSKSTIKLVRAASEPT